MIDKILKTIKSTKTNGIHLTEIFFKFKNLKKSKILKILSQLFEDGRIIKKKDILFSTECLGFFRVMIVKDCKEFLIAEKVDTQSRVIIFKKFSKGALFKDLALVYKSSKKFQKENQLEEVKVEKIYHENSAPFVGVIIKKNKDFFVQPEVISQNIYKIKKSDEKKIKNNDKVIAQIATRSKNYADVTCSILKNCNTSKKALNCANAIILSQGVDFSFSNDIVKQANNLKKFDDVKEFKNRVDLTDEIIFTIDSNTSKDLDDAVSIEKLKDHYILGVHIADVSHYVKQDSAIDQEALKRGCSIYYADRVIPMLPKILSNDLCSLNPNEKKLTISLFLKLDFAGKLLDYKFQKSIISSKIKGIYEEINDILENDSKSKFFNKYEKFLPKINLMLELFKILKKNKINRGCPQISTKESIIHLDSKGKTNYVKEKISGVSEQIIEEFMILANNTTAAFARKKQLPFLYRVHKPPKIEKIFELKELLKKLNINNNEIKHNISQKVLANILKKYENDQLFSILNKSILQTMEKAIYDTKPLGHFGLVLKNYTHFTSPIRRYPDLLIHRILKEYIFNSNSSKFLTKKYKKTVKKASKLASKSEKKAIFIERGCVDCFKAEYMERKIGETFTGIISSIINRGIFVMLNNTVEGFVSIKQLPKDLQFRDNLYFFSKQLNKSYKIGQTVKVSCTNVNISLGKIDFKFVDD